MKIVASIHGEKSELSIGLASAHGLNNNRVARP